MERLLVIRFSALGDVAMLVPVLHRLAEQYPECDITMLSRKQWAPLFTGLPVNVHFFGADLKGRHKGLAGLNRLLSDLQFRHFDAVADMHSVLRTYYLRFVLRLCGKRVAVLRKGKLHKWLAVKHWRCGAAPFPSTLSRYAAVLQRLGLNVALDLTQPQPSQPRASIGIAPFAAHPNKVYPLERMEQVVKAMGEKMDQRGEKVYLFGAGEAEKAVLERWEKDYKWVVSLAGKQTLDKEIDIMRTLRLMVTMDSGNMHLASLAGTRVLSIWGATHPCMGFVGYRQQAEDCIQRDLPCRPCSVYGNKPCRFGHPACLDIPVEKVVERIMKEV